MKAKHHHSPETYRKEDVERLIGHAMRYIMDVSWAMEWMRTSPGDAVGLLKSTLEMEVKPLHEAKLLTDDEYRHIKEVVEKAIKLIEEGNYDAAWNLLFGHRSNVARRVYRGQQGAAIREKPHLHIHPDRVRAGA